MALTRLTPLVRRWLSALLVLGLAADAAWGFFPGLPPTNRVGPGGGGPTPPGSQTPPGAPPPPPPPPPSQSVTPGGPPPATPPGTVPPPPPPFVPPSSGVTPTPPGPIPEINAHGLAAGLGLTLCGILMLTDRKRRRQGGSSPASR